MWSLRLRKAGGRGLSNVLRVCHRIEQAIGSIQRHCARFQIGATIAITTSWHLNLLTCGKTMRSNVDPQKIEQLMQVLGREARGSGSIYFTGGLVH
jgi:hypothetical protein